MKNLTTSIYTFENLIEGDWLYVDKTDYIWDLIRKPQGIYFLSRPRRFGKSLTLSTLKAVFQNKKHLFKGLSLENKPHAWKEYPVIHLDLGDLSSASPELLDASLTTSVNEAASCLGVELKNTGASERFRELILQSSKKDKIVILIDEYDKPILDNVTRENIQSIREVLENFYSVVKATEPYQRFVLLTGVSKFARVSVFSKLNNLADITMDSRYATMLGYTQEELESNFAEHVEHVCREQKMSRTELLSRLKLWYNGYKFHQNAETVYNPVSIGKFFESGGEFKNYWFETGTPSFLLKLAKKQQFDFEKELSQPVSELAFASYEIDKLQTLPLLFQTGYLTIKNAVRYEDDTFYNLDFPNREVEAAFEAYLLDEYSGVNKERIEVYASEMARMLKGKDIDGFMGKMKIFFADIPYDIQLANEKYYQTIFYIVFRLIGLRIEAETRTGIGRIDAVVQTEKYVYIFEFKLDGSADEALKQIHDRDYSRKYLGSGREIILIGANFSTETRNTGEWKTEVLA
ncbi:MAG: ATP-binding protein [Victivallales bacterium]